MKKELLVLFLFILTVLPCLAQKTYIHKKTGLEFPLQLCGMDRETEITDFESEAPGFGVGVVYKQGDQKNIVCSIYLYNLGFKKISTGIQSMEAEDAFADAILEIKEAHKLGYYDDAKKKYQEEIMMSDAPNAQKAYYALFELKDGQELKDSRLLLTVYKNYFVKISFTNTKEVSRKAKLVFLELIRYIDNSMVKTD